jgi:hypothetical protein
MRRCLFVFLFGGNPRHKNATVLLRFYVLGSPAHSAPLIRRETRRTRIRNSQLSTLNSQLWLVTIIPNRMHGQFMICLIESIGDSFAPLQTDLGVG